ncbi:fibrinogen gamma chain-like isoform X1 [Orbicella faveolata]|uniref:fibrinogen gamma chain-like isoform X1 n=1 Tax=Orbicella faveolata TaxID=48498 RepID=UPI0009E44D46|nr:fibrinogen gamma chain-like isoform X1 [Orbicella faveolata]
MLWTVNLCIFLFAGFFMDCVSAGEQCRVERSINGMALQGFVFKKFLVRAFHECDFSCEKEITCQSYNYVKWEKSCELNNRTKEARPENFRSDPARSYIRRLMERAPLGSIPELPAHSCQEIKASEGKDTISSKYWLDPNANGTAVLVNCDMDLEDVDECLNGIHDCDANANCINTVGGHNCSCKEGFAGDGRSCSAYKNNCAEIYKSGERKDGVYTIKPDNLSAFDVFCDQTTAGGGWTVFQKRLNGSVDFFLNWSDYKVGFGDLNGEFWLGLDKIHRLTSDNDSMLRVDLEDFERNTSYAEYNRFGVMSENDKYKLSFGNYSGRKVFFIILHCTGCPNLAA